MSAFTLFKIDHQVSVLFTLACVSVGKSEMCRTDKLAGDPTETDVSV
jgi:hypothetical protein